MIQEFIESLITPITREARSLGYLHESIAMQRRYLRHKKEWQSHLDECRRQILTHASGVETIEILGSGPLLDIPMDELVEKCGRITLVDFVHPRHVKRRWSSHPKVRFIEADLLGIASPLLSWRSGPLPTPLAHKPKADFVISANCLSQLPIKPLEFLNDRVESAVLQKYALQLGDAHLDMLRQYKHLLITDFETRLLGENGEILEKSDPPIPQTRLKLLHSWNWRLAPPGEIDRRQSLEMSVGSFTVL